MKIIVKENPILNYYDIESFVKKTPDSWTETIDSVNVFNCSSKQLLVSYQPKDKQLGVHLPEDYAKTKAKALEMIAIIVQSIKDEGAIPEKIDPDKVSDYRLQWSLVSAEAVLD